jgi:CubicO group peptidase (beta-lactamase class C family)
VPPIELRTIVPFRKESMLKALLITLGASLLWLAFVIVGAFFGLWMQPWAAPGDVDAFHERAAAMLASDNPGHAAFVLLEDGIAVTDYYSENGFTIDGDTVFAVASMSKFITALAVMQLAEAGQVDLDAPVNSYLSRWQLPSAGYDGDEVTVRHLLSHTAGLEDGLGFGDYAADESLPALEDELANPRTSDGATAVIAASAEPGNWQYSGGGYLVLELLIEEITGRTFEDHVRSVIVEPLAMTRSGYGFIGDVASNAGSLTSEGEPAPLYRYASSAATALLSSSTDLTRLIQALVPQAEATRLLDVETLDAMREPHGTTMGAAIWGLGTILYAPIGDGDYLYGHDGGNDPAINSTLRINPLTGDAIIVLVTGHPSIATEIGSQWVLWQSGYPDVLAVDSVIASMLLPAVIGLLVIFLGLLGFVFLRGPRLRSRR